MDLINIILVIVVLLNLPLGHLLLVRSKRASNISYFFVVCGVIIWTTSMIIYRSVPAETSVFWCKILYIAATFTASPFLYFTFIFPKGNRNLLRTLLIIFPNIIVISLIIFTNSVISDVKLIINEEKHIIFGSLYFIYALYISGYFTLGLINLAIQYFKQKGIQRLQIKYIFLGYFLASNLAMATNLTLPWFGNFDYNWLGQILALFMAAFTVYAITRTRFMEIKVMIRKSIIYSILFFVIILFSLIVIIIFYYLLTDYLCLKKEIVLLILMAFLAFIIPNLQKYLRNILDKYINKDIIDLSVSVEKFATSLSRSQELDVFLKRVDEFITENIDTNNIKIAIRDIRVPELQYVCQLPKNGCIEQISELKELQNFFKENPINIYEELQYLESKNKEDKTALKIIKKLLEKNKAQCIIALRNAETINGFLIIGKKVSKDGYSAKEINFITEFAKQTEDLLERVMFYEETLERVRRDYLDNRPEMKQ